MKFDADDLIILPDNMTSKGHPPFLVYKMKNLHTPSIISSSGVKTMSALALSEHIKEWFHTATSLEPELKAFPGVPSIDADNEFEFEEPYSAKFLRHVRPYETEFGVYTNISPTGGVSFCIVLEPANHKFRFSYSICMEEDLFNKKIASRICEGRMAGEDWYELSQYSPEISAVENIKYAIAKHLRGSVVDDKIVADLPVLTKLSPRVKTQKQDLTKILDLLVHYY